VPDRADSPATSISKRLLVQVRAVSRPAGHIGAALTCRRATLRPAGFSKRLAQRFGLAAYRGRFRLRRQHVVAGSEALEFALSSVAARLQIRKPVYPRNFDPSLSFSPALLQGQFR